MATFVQVSDDLQQRISKLQSTDKLLLTVAREMYIITSKRIFVDGIMTDGGKWKYSSKTILAGFSSFSTKAGFNKFAGSKKQRKDLNWVTLKNGAKVFEVQGGFKSIKQADGHTNPFDFTGQLRRSYTYDGTSNASYVGFADISRKTPDGKSSNTTNEQVREGLEERQGKIFDLTADEDKDVDKIVDEYLNTILG